MAVRAWNAAGWSGWTNSSSILPYYVNPPAVPPPAVVSIDTSRSGSTLTASWDAVNAATKYHVTYSENGGASWSLAAMNHPAATPRTAINISIDAAKTYVVAARAGNNVGWSGWRSSPASAPNTLAAPASTTMAHNGSSLSIEWDAVSGASGYNVEMRDAAGGSWSPLQYGVTATSTTTFAPNHRSSYQARVQAIAEGGGSPWTESAVAHPSMQPPATPYWIKLSRTGNDTVQATWNAVPNVTGYNVAYSGDNRATWTSVSIAAEDSSAFFNLSLSKTWVARVQAVNVYGGSQWQYSGSLPSPTFSVEGFLDYAEMRVGNFGGNWYYKADVGPHADCQGPVSGGKLTVSGLANATDYIYSVHDNERCDADADADDFDDTPVNVSNLGETTIGTVATIGRFSNTSYKNATSFTTGSHNGGYTLQSVTIGVWQVVGSPSALNLAIHAASGGSPAGSATYTLSGTSPTGGGDYTYTCSGTCTLAANTAYYLVMTANTPGSGDSYYGIDRTASNSHTNTPSSAGWSIADVYEFATTGSNFWQNNSSSYVHQFKVTAAPINPDARSVNNLGGASGSTGAIVGRYSNNSIYLQSSPFTTGSDSDGYTLQSVTIGILRILGSPTGFNVAIHAASGNAPASQAIYTLTGTSPTAAGNVTYTCSVTCALAANTTYHLVMSANVPGSGEHYYDVKRTKSDNETNTPSSAGWSIGNVYRYKQDSNLWAPNTPVDSFVHQFKVTATTAGATSLARPVSFTTLTPLDWLTATDVADTSATLKMDSQYTGVNWYYKQHGHNSCVAVSGRSVDLTGLTAGTLYGYSAYNYYTCQPSYEFGRTYFTTTNAGVGNMTNLLNGGCVIGKPSGTTERKCAVAFTTGSNPNGGYFLDSVTVQLGIDGGGTIRAFADLHAESNGRPAAKPMARLGNTTGKARGSYTFTCEHKGVCNLAENTKYFIVVSAPYSAYNYWRHWETRNSGQEYRWPNDRGWAIVSGAMSKTGSGGWARNAAAGKTPVFHVAANKTHATLAAQTVQTNQASLRISGHTGAWYYKANVGPHKDTCTAVSSGDRVSALGLTAETYYVYTVYNDSQCTEPLASTQFTTLPTATLTATVNSDNSVHLTLSNGPNDWWFKISFSCVAAGGTRYPTSGGMQGYTGGPHTVTAYTDSNCTTELASTTFTIP